MPLVGELDVGSRALGLFRGLARPGVTAFVGSGASSDEQPIWRPYVRSYGPASSLPDYVLRAGEQASEAAIVMRGLVCEHFVLQRRGRAFTRYHCSLRCSVRS